MLHILGIIALVVLCAVGALILLGGLLAALVLSGDGNPFQ